MISFISFSEEDWKIFRSKIGSWQEAYMDRLNREYMEILAGEGTPSEKFWKLEERINRDKHDYGVQCKRSRSQQFTVMMALLEEGVITMADLEEFSDDVKDTFRELRDGWDTWQDAPAEDDSADR